MTSKICKILFPVDFSNRSVLAVRHVKTWIDRFGAGLDTLHVIDADALGNPAKRREDLIMKRTADLKYFSDHYFGETGVHDTVLSGGTADQIEHFATITNVDLIMLPRNHQNIGARFLRDSLTATILDRCTASVWTTEHVETAQKLSINSILCAVHFEGDVTLDSQNYRILQSVQELTSAFDAKVTFLHVINRQEAATAKTFADLSIVSGVGPWLEQARERLGGSAMFLRKSGDVIPTISETANQVAADLIVVGHTRPGTLGLGVQSHILKIDHAARRPVLSIW
jgi:nucleotide-binding universal stress UspA family protein